MRNKTILPDNLHFYKKNVNNVLPVVLNGDTNITLDYSKSIGESEVAINLLGIPRSETRGVLYEDVSTYGLNPNTWVFSVSPDASRGWAPLSNDPNIISYNFPRVHVDRFNNKKINLLAGSGNMWVPGAQDPVCPQSGVSQENKYKLPNSTFLPTVHHDPQTSCIVMDGWPSEYGYTINFDPAKTCTPPPGGWFITNDQCCNYVCRLESRETYRYEPGKVIGFTFGISTSIEETLGFNYCENKPQHKQAKWGVKNNTDAYYFLLDGTELKLVRESIFSSNQVVLTKDKFLDSLDGTGPSKANIDLSKITMFSIEFSWYGAIGATFFAYLPVGFNETKWVKIAELPASNKFSVPALSDPYMKMFMELEIPWRCKKPHFFKKYGTSVYMDGKGNKGLNFSKSGSINTTVKYLEKNYDRNICVVEVPEKNPLGVSKYNKNRFIPKSIQAYFNEAVLLTVEKVMDNKLLNFAMPVHTLSLSGIENINKLFYNGSNRPFRDNISKNQTNGTLQEYSDSFFNFVLPLSGSIMHTANNFNISVPEEYNINEVARHLLFSYNTIYNPLVVNRLVSNNFYSFFSSPFRTRSDGDFNFIKGLEILPRISSIKRVGERLLNLRLHDYYRNSYQSWQSTDGQIVTAPLDVNHLDSAFVQSIGTSQNYPNYGSNNSGQVRIQQLPYGGVISQQQPIYDTDCKVVVNKNLYNNSAYYIVNTKIDTGTITYQPPINEYMCGFITQTTLNYLTSVDFFKNIQIDINQTINSNTHNIQDYLRSNSVIGNHQYLYYGNNTLDAHNIFTRTTSISSIYYNNYGNYVYLKPAFYTFRNSPPGLNIDTLFPYNGQQFLLQQQLQSNIVYGNTYGFTLNRHKVKIRATAAQIISSTNSLYNTYEISFDDVFYLKDGVFTNSMEFWIMLINNHRFLNLNAKFSIQDQLIANNTNPIIPIWSPWNGTTPLIDFKLQVRLSKTQFAQGGIIDLDLRTVTYKGMTSTSLNGFDKDLSLASTTVIPHNENLYFYFASATDLSGSNNYFHPTEQSIKSNIGDSRTNCTICVGKNPDDYRFSFVKFDVRDNKGVKSSNTSSIYNNLYYTVKDNWVKSSNISQGAKTSLIALSGTSYSQENSNIKNFNSAVYSADNNYSQIYSRDSFLYNIMYGVRNNTNISTYNFFIPKNTKHNIDLNYIFNMDREKILPTLHSSFLDFDSTFIIKARTLSADNAQGHITFNFEELV